MKIKQHIKKMTIGAGAIGLGALVGTVGAMPVGHQAKVVQKITPAIKAKAKTKVGIDMKATYHFRGGSARNRFHEMQLTAQDVTNLNALLLKTSDKGAAETAAFNFLTTKSSGSSTKTGWEYGDQVSANLNSYDDASSISLIMHDGGYPWSDYPAFNINDLQYTVSRAAAAHSAMKFEFGCDYEFIAHNMYEVTYSING